MNQESRIKQPEYSNEYRREIEKLIKTTLKKIGTQYAGSVQQVICTIQNANPTIEDDALYSLIQDALQKIWTHIQDRRADQKKITRGIPDSRIDRGSKRRVNQQPNSKRHDRD